MTDGGPELPIVKHPASSSHDDSGASLLLTNIEALTLTNPYLILCSPLSNPQHNTRLK